MVDLGPAVDRLAAADVAPTAGLDLREMINVEHIEDWRGKEILDPAGESLGKLQEVFLDNATGTPILLAFKSGLLGRRTKLIPVDGATVGPDHVRVVHDKVTVEASPEATSDDPPDAVELDEIGKAYGLMFSDQVKLESAGAAEGRRAAAQAARQRADELEAAAREKIAARDAASDQARGATEDAGQAEREAEEARRAAELARTEASRYDDE